jgi:hypothetical protein
MHTIFCPHGEPSAGSTLLLLEEVSPYRCHCPSLLDSSKEWRNWGSPYSSNVETDTDQEERPQDDGKYCRDHSMEACEVHKILVGVGHEDTNNGIDHRYDRTNRASTHRNLLF